MCGSSKSRMYRKITVGDKLRSILELIAEDIKSDYSTSWKKGGKKEKSEDCSGLRASWEWTRRSQANPGIMGCLLGFFSLTDALSVILKRNLFSMAELKWSLTPWRFFFPNSLEGEPKHWLRCTWKNQVQLFLPLISLKYGKSIESLHKH